MSRKGSGYYDNQPWAPQSKRADRAAIPGPALGSNEPVTVPDHPGKSTGFGGPTHVAGHRPRGGIGGPGSGTVRKLGTLKLSGHSGAHQIGKKTPFK